MDPIFALRRLHCAQDQSALLPCEPGRIKTTFINAIIATRVIASGHACTTQKNTIGIVKAIRVLSRGSRLGRAEPHRHAQPVTGLDHNRTSDVCTNTSLFLSKTHMSGVHIHFPRNRRHSTSVFHDTDGVKSITTDPGPACLNLTEETDHLVTQPQPTPPIVQTAPTLASSQ